MSPLELGENAPERLFVYGTLRRACGHSMHRLMEHAEFLGDATFQGRLYLVGTFPGAVKSSFPDDLVQGEVYRLVKPAELLPRLDAYEDFDPRSPETSLYRREKATLRLESGEFADAWIYLYNRPTENLPRIVSGDFLDAAKS